ncbi:ABC transporter permease [Clostridium oryzae]|nr:ABC transporter permease [Clostridium oryzae]
MLTLVSLEINKLKRSKIMYVCIGTMFLFFLCAAAQGLKSNYSAHRIMEDTLTYSTFLIFPALLAVIGSYMIGKEFEEDTMKNILIIPVNFARLAAAKLITTLIIGIAMSLFLFLFTIITCGIATSREVTAVFVLVGLKNYILQAIGCFLAVVPIISAAATVKNGYLISVVITEIYSFAGLFAASSNYRDLYPISAAFGFSGAVGRVRLTENLICGLVLLACLAAGLIILKIKQSSEK